ncbi:MAG: hypothetical protein WBP94_01060 [Rhodomicrobiaceae bacterium]
MANPPLPEPPYDGVLIFTGHMTDAPNRRLPRFPPSLEPFAAKAIDAQITAFRARFGTGIGIASGARGGDILFHEACTANGLPTILVLPFSVDAFRRRSISGAATGDWEARFDALWHRLLPENRIILDGEHDPDPFGACNREMLALAQRHGKHVEHLALWDGADIGKPGGTGAFVQEVRARGGHVMHLDTRQLLAQSRKHSKS